MASGGPVPVVGTPLQPKDPRLTPRNFTKLRELGCGDIGKVYLVKSRGLAQDGLYALKVVDKAEMRKREKECRIQTERDVLAASKHPFIATLHCAFQTKRKLYLVLQFCSGGELLGLIWKQPHHRLSEDAARFYAAEVLTALEYLHALGFIYRDLKPENILVHDTGHVILTDFDLAAGDVRFNRVAATFKSHTGPRFRRKKLPKPVVRGYTIKARQKSFVGTTEYMAPEVLEQDGYDQRVDWWEFGILVFEMLFGAPPFRGDDRDATFDMIHDGKLRFPKEPKVSKNAKSLIKKLLTKDRDKRLCGAGQIRRHKWFRPVEWALLRNRTPPILPEGAGAGDTTNFHIDDEDMERFHESDFEEDEEVGESDLDEEFVEGDGETPSRYRKWKSFDYVRHGGDQHWSPAEVEDLEARDGERDTLFSGAACDDVEGEEDEEDDDDEEPVGAAAEAVSEAAIAEDAVEEEKGT